MPTMLKQQSDRFVCVLQRHLGLYISAATAHFDSIVAAGGTVTECERLGDTLAHKANHNTAHKWTVFAWRDAEAASTGGVVYQGDKSKGQIHYSRFCASTVPDIIKLDSDDGGSLPELGEIKNYSWCKTAGMRTGAPEGVVRMNGHSYLCGNTEERLKYKVKGTRRRGLAAMGAFNHRTGAGFIKAKRGDYWDAIEKRKGRVHLLVHESLGGMSPMTARRLRRLARLAKERGTDGTDYTRSYTARGFVPYYAQLISSTIVMNGAAGIIGQIKKEARRGLGDRACGAL